jgi:hypothetical protein
MYRKRSLNGTAKYVQAAPRKIKTYKRFESCRSKRRHDGLSDAQEIPFQSGKEKHSYSNLKLCLFCKHETVAPSRRVIWKVTLTQHWKQQHMYTQGNKQCIRKAYISKSKALSAILSHYSHVNSSGLLTRKLHTDAVYSELLGFWTLSIVRYSKNLRTQRFGNRICFRPQVTSARHLLCCIP